MSDDLHFTGTYRGLQALRLALQETDLAKAVAAHHSHIQARTHGGRFTTHHAGRRRPRTPTGAFAARLTAKERAAATDQVNRYADEYGRRLQRHLADLLEHRLTAAECHERAAEDVRHFYDLAFRGGMQAAGDPGLVLPEDRALLNRIVRDELDYLRAFLGDVDAGRGRLDYRRRMGLYQNPLKEGYWAGFVLANQDRARELRWRRGATNESCSDCLRFVALGWLPVADFLREIVAKGYLPRSGNLECIGIHCQCFLEERVRGRVTALPPL